MVRKMMFSALMAVVLTSWLHAEEAPEAKPASPPDEIVIAQAYLLPNCPISNKSIGSMNAAASKMIDGRAVMVCCPGCFNRYEKTPEKYKAKIDAQVIEMQSESYPLTTCLASGRPIDVKGTPTDAVYGNRLMRFCCGGCAQYVINDQARLAKALKTLDQAAIAKQKPNSKATTCPISNEPLGEDSVDVVVGGTLVRVCCDQCRKKVVKSPREVMVSKSEG